jgi:hypothetical protein
VGGSRRGHCSGGANSRAEFNLLRAGKRQFHAMGFAVSVIPPASRPCADQPEKWFRIAREEPAH